MNRSTISNWAVGITTAPRPTPTLPRTQASLARAGWPEAHIFCDEDQRGAWPTWLAGLGQLVRQHPRAEAYLMVQDDAVFCRQLRQYLETALWPADDVALCSPYCPTPYRAAGRGWHRQDRGWYLVGAVCWALAAEAARRVVRELAEVRSASRIDAHVGRWAARSGCSVWYHTPSLVQHVGNGNSALGDEADNALRRAADFIGEDASALAFA
jgi:hypothetical protein